MEKDIVYNNGDGSAAVPRFRSLEAAIEDDANIDSIDETWLGQEKDHLRDRASERFPGEINTDLEYRGVLGMCLVEVDDGGIVTTHTPTKPHPSVNLYTLLGNQAMPAIIRTVVIDGVIRPRTIIHAFALQWPRRLAARLGLTMGDFRPANMPLYLIPKKMRRWLN